MRTDISNQQYRLLESLTPESWHQIRTDILGGEWVDGRFMCCSFDPDEPGGSKALTSQLDWSQYSSQTDHYNEIATLIGTKYSERLVNSFGIVNLNASRQLSVVIPVFNEASTIEEVIRSVASQPAVDQVIVVNDGSSDQTDDVCRGLVEQFENADGVETAGSMSPWFLKKGFEYIELKENRGKGFAIRQGIALAKCPWVCIQDADKEYDPRDLYRLLLIGELTSANVVYGNRFHECHDKDFTQADSEIFSELKNSGVSLYFETNRKTPLSKISPVWHQSGNKVLSKIASFRSGARLNDVETCQKVFSTQKIQAILDQLKENRFGIEIEMTVKLSRMTGVSFSEGPISYHRRGYGEGKKIGWKDAVRALYCLFIY